MNITSVPRTGFLTSWASLALIPLVFAQPSAPVFNPMGGRSFMGFGVVITCPTPGAVIRYTTDGTTPDASDPAIVSGHTLIIPRSLTLKASGWLNGNSSSVTSADYQVVGKIAPGVAHVIAVKSNEMVYTWGRRQNGALGDQIGTNTILATPQRVYFALDAAAGNQHSLWLNVGGGGGITSHGWNTSGQLGINTVTTPPNFTPWNGVIKSTIPDDYLMGCVQVAAADTYSAALVQTGEVYTWGANTSGRLGRIVSGSDSRYAKVVKKAVSPYETLTGIEQIVCGNRPPLHL